MYKTTLLSRPSDGRIELTNLIKTYNACERELGSLFAYTAKCNRGYMMRIFKDVDTHQQLVEGNIGQELTANVEDRFFVTPTVKKPWYSVRVGVGYINIA